MKLLMFDIDGTLTQTDGVDEVCFVQALWDVCGFAGVDTDWAGYPHCSDSGILEALFQARLGRSVRPSEIAEVQVRFIALLAETSAGEPFSEVPGAGRFLHSLLEDSTFAVSIASGAWECAARLKLAGAGLEFPRIPAAFSDSAYAREVIMQTSLGRAARFHARESFQNVIYFGDGVWDARAARHLGYHFIGIADASDKAERLRAEGAHRVFSDFTDAETLMGYLHAFDSSLIP
jgi:phosphoglycolate phosphatase-like HAD superfamily hydrolase